MCVCVSESRKCLDAYSSASDGASWIKHDQKWGSFKTPKCYRMAQPRCEHINYFELNNISLAVISMGMWMTQRSGGCTIYPHHICLNTTQGCVLSFTKLFRSHSAVESVTVSVGGAWKLACVFSLCADNWWYRFRRLMTAVTLIVQVTEWRRRQQSKVVVWNE